MSPFRQVPAAFLIALLALGSAVTAGVVPGAFTTDDNNYLINVLALREGRLTVSQTDGLPPSNELLFFDPGPWSRRVTATPVVSTAPPLYAPIALPFSIFGWRGLVMLNTLSYLATALIVFIFVRSRSSNQVTPWVAASAFALGGFSIEYAQGVWPHSLSVFLCTAGVLLAVEASETGTARGAALAGGLIALAAGVRYQNAGILAAVAIGLLLWSARRRQTIVAFVLAAAIPLSASSAINHARHGSWNPISKGSGYLSLPDDGSSSRNAGTMFWARLVDYSVRPQLTSRGFTGWISYDAASGIHTMPGGIVKKAFVQSAPWAALGFAVMFAAWLRPGWVPLGARRALLMSLLVAAATIAVFSFSGTGRDDGLSFNQRYLLELVPLAAMAAAWGLDAIALRVRGLTIGVIAGAGAFVLAMVAVEHLTFDRLVIMKIPILQALFAIVCWLIARRGVRFHAVAVVVTGVCFGWAAAVHLTQDLHGSHDRRQVNLARTVALSPTLPEGSVLVAYWGHKDAAVPLLLDRNILILDTRADDGADAPMLIRHLLGSGRRVVLLDEGFPSDVRARVITGLQIDRMEQTIPRLLVLRLGGS